MIFLAERQYETLNQLAEAADRFEEAHSRVGPTTGIGKGLMVDRETTTGRKAIMTRKFLEPRRLPVGTTARYPRRKLCVSTVTNLAI